MEQQREIKLTFKGTVKRFVFPNTYKGFLETINSTFPQTRNKTISINYVDEEGDQITISTEFDYENCSQFLKSNNISLLRVNVDCDSNSFIVEETVSTNEQKNEEKKEQPKEEKQQPKEENEVKGETKEEKEKKEQTFEENCEEKVKKIIQNGYENVKDFVEKNGGIENVFTLFKDDLHSLKTQFLGNLKEGFKCFPGRGHHHWKKFNERNCWQKQTSNSNFKDGVKTNESVEDFKKKIEKKLEKSFNKMKDRLVNKMVKKYEKLLAQQNQTQQTQSNSSANTQNSNVIHERVTCDGCGMHPIRGIRYKCTTCDNFDYCEKCEETVDHGHVFMKIKSPIVYSNRPNHNFRNRGPQNHQESGDQNIRQNRCNFFKNMFENLVKGQEPQQSQKKQETKIETSAKNEKKDDGYDFLVKEIKQTYDLQIDDSVILEALKKANGDVEQTMLILFS